MTDRKPAGHLIIPILVFLITELVVTLIIAYATGEGWLPDAEMSNIATSVSAIANLMVLFFCERKMGLGTLTRRSLFGRFAREGEERLALRAAASVLITILMGICLNIFLNGLVLMTGIQNVDPLYKSAADTFAEGSPAMQIIAYGILVPAAEEWLFRGMVYSFFKSRFRTDRLLPPAAVLLTSLVFAVFHGNFTQGIYVFFLSIALCLAAECGGLVLSAVMHMCVNLVSLIGNHIGVYTDTVGNMQAHLPALFASAVLTVLFSLILVRLSRKN